MANKVNYIPKGYNTVTPYICVNGADRAIEFYKKVFGAEEVMRMPYGDKVGHAELRIGDSKIMLSDEYPEMDVRGPMAIGGSPVTISVYVEDVDAVVQRAVSAGAKIIRPVENQFYGDRTGQIQDPFGHKWSIGTHIEDVSREEMEKRLQAFAHKS
jgi:PhnB protein